MRDFIKNISFCITAYLVCIASCIYGFPNPDGPPPNPEKMHEHMEKRFDMLLEKLNLTAQQKAQLENHRASHKKAGKKFHEAMMRYHRALKDELEKGILNRTEIQNIVTEIKSLMAQSIDDRVSAILAIRDILTPEQFKQLQAEREKMHQTMKRQCIKKAAKDADREAGHYDMF